MAAPKGNEYYKLAKEKLGRKQLITDPNVFLDGWNNYVEFCLNTPLKLNVVQKIKVDKDLEEIKIVEIPHTRPFTLKGYCNYMSISFDLFCDYIKKEEFSNILTHIQQQCFAQKFEGAAIGAYNATIIARDLGLVDKQDINQSIEIVDFTE